MKTMNQDIQCLKGNEICEECEECETQSRILKDNIIQDATTCHSCGRSVNGITIIDGVSLCRRCLRARN